MILAALVAGWAPAATWARAPKKRKVAVLEYRAGATGASDLGGRMAAILRTTTSLVVIDPDDARRILGDDVDAELAKCGGEPACVARLGKRLDADEVLLVGVSELGDLIVALQRVDVRSREVTSRLAESLPRGDEPDDATLEGWLRRLLPPEDFRRYGTIRVRANVDGAVVVIGGTRRGVTPLDPIQVPAPAQYDVRVSKPGYVDFTAQIDVPPDATVEVRPELSRRGAADAWYGKWWVWAIAGAAVTGVVVTGIVVSEDDPTSVPVTVFPF